MKYFWSKTNTNTNTNEKTNEIDFIKMKLSSSSEYTLAFLDILCYKNPSTKYFNMTHPITLMLGLIFFFFFFKFTFLKKLEKEAFSALFSWTQLALFFTLYTSP